MRRGLAVLGIALVVSGCGTISSGQYAVLREELHSDPQVRRQAIADCQSDFSGGSAADRANLAALTGTSTARAPHVACSRIFNAIANGRISYSDFRAAGGDYSKWIEVIRG